MKKIILLAITLTMLSACGGLTDSYDITDTTDITETTEEPIILAPVEEFLTRFPTIDDVIPSQRVSEWDEEIDDISQTVARYHRLFEIENSEPLIVIFFQSFQFHGGLFSFYKYGENGYEFVDSISWHTGGGPFDSYNLNPFMNHEGELIVYIHDMTGGLFWRINEEGYFYIAASYTWGKIEEWGDSITISGQEDGEWVSFGEMPLNNYIFLRGLRGFPNGFAGLPDNEFLPMVELFGE